ncbi:MAG TPA: hypothetical protein VET23_08340 [Chitinophagaceae bacterium]|nr:hypothetical protein [Chitinophagaceae bacterium]
MKQIFSILILGTILWSCGNNNQNKALNDAKQVQSEIKKIQPGGIPTTEAGWTMKAKINGKEWVANSIISPDAAGRIVGDNNGESISLPYDRRDIVAGNKTKFGENNAVDLFTNDDVGIWGGRKGEMEITKVDNNWAEGKFFFTGSSSRSDKTVEVTDGFFRIALTK